MRTRRRDVIGRARRERATRHDGRRVRAGLVPCDRCVTGTLRRAAIASRHRGDRRPDRASRRGGRRRPPPGSLVRGDARRRSPTRTTRTSTRCSCSPASPSTPTATTSPALITRAPARRLRARRSAPTPASAPPPTRCSRLVEGDNGFFCICHDDVALDPDAIRALVEELYRSNAGIVGPKLVSWDDRGRPAARRPRPRPLRRGRPDHRAGRVRPGAARRGRATCSCCRRPACSSAPTCSARSAASTAPSRSTATTSTCAGGPTSAGPGSWSPRRPASATARSSTVRRPDLNHDMLRARHRMRSVVTLTSGGRLPLRSLELAVLTVAELFVGLFTGRLGEAWASLRAFVGLRAAHPERCSPGAARSPSCATSTTPRSCACRTAAAPGCAAYRRARDTETYIGTEATVRRWRESPLSTTIAWVVVVVVHRRGQPHDVQHERCRTSASSCRCPASPREWWARLHVGVEPRRPRRHGRQPDRVGRAVDRQRAVAVPPWASGSRCSSSGSSCSASGARGAWPRVFPSNRARIAALVVYTAMPLVPGVISTGRLSALVAYAAVPWFVHLLRVAVGIGTADPAAAAADLVDGVLAPSDSASASGARRCWRSSPPSPSPLAPAVLPVLVVVTVVLGLTTLVANAGWRTAGWIAGLGLAACVGAWVLNLPWSTTWSWSDLVAAAARRRRPGAGVADVASMAIGRGQFELVSLWRCTCRSSIALARRAGMAPDVGGARRRARRRVPRPRRAAGPRRAAVPDPRDRHPARAGRPRAGDLGGGVDRRRSATTSPGARSDGASRWACSPSPRSSSASSPPCSRSPTAPGTRRGRA